MALLAVAVLDGLVQVADAGDLRVHLLVAVKAQPSLIGHQQLRVHRRVRAVAGAAAAGPHRAVGVLAVARHVVVAGDAQRAGVFLAEQLAAGGAVGVVAGEALSLFDGLVDHQAAVPPDVAEIAQPGLGVLELEGVLGGVVVAVARFAGADRHGPVDVREVALLRVAAAGEAGGHAGLRADIRRLGRGGFGGGRLGLPRRLAPHAGGGQQHRAGCRQRKMSAGSADHLGFSVFMADIACSSTSLAWACFSSSWVYRGL